MTATADPPPATASASGAPYGVRLGRAEGITLLGPVQGSGYRDCVALVRRADGQMVQLGPLMYGLLECADGRRTADELASALSVTLGRKVGEDHVLRLAEKLAGQGLISGTEHNAPPRRSPLLALRWKVLVTDERLTRRLTAPFAFLFNPWILWPVLVCFGLVSWFVLVQKGVASATAQAFQSPGLLVLVFALAVISAGFHELGHAAACRYGGATPGGMGAGLYLVWPAFYTDVTDAYRLPRKDRLRVDLAGLYFNAVAADLTMLVWLFWRMDALLLLVAVQILQMVKQLSPIIRADGYHILADATGVPDLYAHIGPTLRRLLPGRSHQPAALTGRARLLVTVWVLVIVPVLLSLMLGAILLLPRLATSAWDSGHLIVHALPHEVSDFQAIKLGASLLQLVALILPVAGSVLIVQKMVRTYWAKARLWSAGRPLRRVLLAVGTAGLVALLAWAWWPSGQYRPVRADQGGTIQGLVHLVSSGGGVARSGSGLQLQPGAHLALAMVPVSGASPAHPAMFIVPGPKGRPATEILSSGPGKETRATAFPFVLPPPPGPGGTQALALGVRDGGVTYRVAYALITVDGGAPVTETNSAFALADCRACTTVAVSFQLVLVIGQSADVAPIDAAGALNYDCPACSTTAIADQMVVTLTSQPSPQLLSELQASLAQLDDISALGANSNPQAIAAEVSAVQEQVETELASSGLVAGPVSSATTVAGASSTFANGAASSTTTSTPAGADTTSPTTASSSGTTQAGTNSTPSTGTTAPTTVPTTDQSAPSTTTASTASPTTTGGTATTATSAP